MFMPKLAALYRAMKKADRTMEQFQFTLKGVTLDIIYTIDTNPFQLLVGIKTHNFFFTVPVGIGFNVGLMDNGTFYALKKLLNFRSSGKPFTSFSFLKELDNHAPSQVSANPVQPHEYVALLPLRERSQIDEADKIYFVGWKHHLNNGYQARNFDKTLRMTGSQEIADFCRKNNVSSMWSDKPRDCKAFVFPKGYRKGV